jgi:hypothetical protein
MSDEQTGRLEIDDLLPARLTADTDGTNGTNGA